MRNDAPAVYQVYVYTRTYAVYIAGHGEVMAEMLSHGGAC